MTTEIYKLVAKLHKSDPDFHFTQEDPITKDQLVKARVPLPKSSGFSTTEHERRQARDKANWALTADLYTKTHIKYSAGDFSFYNPAHLDVFGKPLASQVEGITITFSTEAFTGLKTAAKCCSKDPFRPALMGVYCNFTGTEVKICGTDAHKLYFDSFPLAGEPMSFIIPAKLVAKAKTITVMADGQFSIGGQVHEFIDAKFPDYKAVIPTDHTNTVLFGAQACHTIKQAVAAANPHTESITFTFGQGFAFVEGEDIDLNKSFKADLDAQSDCDFRVSVNGKFLLGIIGNNPFTLKFNPAYPNRILLINSNYALCSLFSN